jgi:hypothetical protein
VLVERLDLAVFDLLVGDVFGAAAELGGDGGANAHVAEHLQALFFGEFDVLAHGFYSRQRRLRILARRLDARAQVTHLPISRPGCGGLRSVLPHLLHGGPCRYVRVWTLAMNWARAMGAETLLEHRRHLAGPPRRLLTLLAALASLGSGLRQSWHWGLRLQAWQAACRGPRGVNVLSHAMQVFSGVSVPTFMA